MRALFLSLAPLAGQVCDIVPIHNCEGRGSTSFINPPYSSSSSSSSSSRSSMANMSTYSPATLTLTVGKGPWVFIGFVCL
uniref:Putative secreted protein n=1 Tax=Anopheles marajoara TaxID=58244 RepID=A0A2M4CC05_9DIPT